MFGLLHIGHCLKSFAQNCLRILSLCSPIEIDKKKVRVYVVLIVIHTDEYATMFYFCFCVTSKKRTKANTNHSLKYFCCINNKIHSKTSEQLIINVSTVSRDCEQFYLINEIVFLIFITNCKQEILFILMQPLSSITAYH
jgi:hypothetical protein